MNRKDVENTVADLNNMAIYADHTGNKMLGASMRKAARLMNDMLHEIEPDKPPPLLILMEEHPDV
jgi:hypothetical protein